MNQLFIIDSVDSSNSQLISYLCAVILKQTDYGNISDNDKRKGNAG